MTDHVEKEREAEEEEREESEPFIHPDSCIACEGTGKVSLQDEAGIRWIRCPVCKGRGRASDLRRYRRLLRRIRRQCGRYRRRGRRGGGGRGLFRQHWPVWSRGDFELLEPEEATFAPGEWPELDNPVESMQRQREWHEPPLPVEEVALPELTNPGDFVDADPSFGVPAGLGDARLQFDAVETGPERPLGCETRAWTSVTLETSPDMPGGVGSELALQPGINVLGDDVAPLATEIDYDVTGLPFGIEASIPGEPGVL